MPEIFECTDCYNRDVLTTHGFCARCGSKSVVSIHVLNRAQEFDILADIFTHSELEMMFGIVMGKVAKA